MGFAILLFSCNNDEPEINNKCTFSVNGVKKVFTCTDATNQYPRTESNMWFITWESADRKEKIYSVTANGGGMAVVTFTYTVSDSISYDIVDLNTQEHPVPGMSWGTKSVIVNLSDIPGVGVYGTIENGEMYRYRVARDNSNREYLLLIDSVQITGGPISAKWTREVNY